MNLLKSKQEIEEQINIAKRKLSGARRSWDKAALEGRINALEWGINKTRQEIEVAIIHYKKELKDNEDLIALYSGPCLWAQEIKGVVRALEWMIRLNKDEERNKTKHNAVLNSDGTPKKRNSDGLLPIFVKECYIKPRR